MENEVENKYNPYEDELVYLIGIYKDTDEDILLEKYGITMEEYLNPNEETIAKVKMVMGIEEEEKKKAI